MLIRAKSIINLPIIEMIGLKKIAHIRDILVDPDNGRMIALILKKNFFWDKQKVVVVKDIANFFADGILIQNDEIITEIDDIIKAKEFFVKKFFFLGSKVLTTEGKALGHLEDFVFDREFFQVMTLVVKKGFSSERRIISAERIINILPRKIIIRDAGVKMPVAGKKKIARATLSN